MLKVSKVLFCCFFLQTSKLFSFFVKLVMTADWNEYRQLIESADYPNCQCVLRLEPLDIGIEREDIDDFFQGIFDICMHFILPNFH